MDVFCLNISYMWTSDVGKYFCQCLWSFSSKLDWGLFRLYFSSLAMLKLLTILVEAQLLITLRFCVQFAMPTLYVRCKFLCCPNFNTTALSVYCTSVLVKQIFLVLHNVQRKHLWFWVPPAGKILHGVGKLRETRSCFLHSAGRQPTKEKKIVQPPWPIAASILCTVCSIFLFWLLLLFVEHGWSSTLQKMFISTFGGVSFVKWSGWFTLQSEFALKRSDLADLRATV